MKDAGGSTGAEFKDGEYVDAGPRPRVEAFLWTGERFSELRLWLRATGRTAVAAGRAVRIVPDGVVVDPGRWVVRELGGPDNLWAADDAGFRARFEPASARPTPIEFPNGVSSEVISPGRWQVALAAPTADEFKRLFCSYASKIGLVAHDVGLPPLSDFLPPSEHGEHGELAAWRRWARGLLRDAGENSARGTDGDDASRRAIEAAYCSAGPVGVYRPPPSPVDQDARPRAAFELTCLSCGNFCVEHHLVDGAGNLDGVVAPCRVMVGDKLRLRCGGERSIRPGPGPTPGGDVLDAHAEAVFGTECTASTDDFVERGPLCQVKAIRFTGKNASEVGAWATRVAGEPSHVDGDEAVIVVNVGVWRVKVVAGRWIVCRRDPDVGFATYLHDKFEQYYRPAARRDARAAPAVVGVVEVPGVPSAEQFAAFRKDYTTAADEVLEFKSRTEDELAGFNASPETGRDVWYVAHRIRPTDEDVAAYRACEDAAIRDAREDPHYPTGFVTIKRMSDHRVRREIVSRNLVDAKARLAGLAARYPSLTFVAPYVASLEGGGGDDLDPALRERGLRDCCRTVALCAGIVLTGDRVSEGMRLEARAAARVVDLTKSDRSPGQHQHHPVKTDRGRTPPGDGSPHPSPGGVVGGLDDRGFGGVSKADLDDLGEVLGRQLRAARVTPAPEAEDPAVRELRDAVAGVPRGGASGSAPAWVVRLHRAACEVAGIEVREVGRPDVVDQPPPARRDDLIPVWDLVVKDMEDLSHTSASDSAANGSARDRVVVDMRERDRVGRERYGVPLTAHNGRDQLIDLYQELLDAAAYSRARIEEERDAAPGSIAMIHRVYRKVIDSLLDVRHLIDLRPAGPA